MSQQNTRAKQEKQSELIFDEPPASRPPWGSLSEEAQRSVTELFARMLRPRRQGEEAQSPAHEVDRE